MNTLRIRIFVAGMLSLGRLSAQKLPELIPYREDDKWGYCDSAKKVLIPPAYESADFFREGVAVVKKNGRYGYIDSRGREITKIIYEAPRDRKPFFGSGRGLISVKTGEGYRYGYVDRKGKVLRRPEIFETSGFVNGVAVIWKEDYSKELVDTNFNVLSNSIHANSSEGQFIRVPSGTFAESACPGNLGLVNTAGKVIVPCNYERIHVYNDLVIAQGQSSAVYDHQGNVLVPEGRYSRIDPFLGGFAFAACVEGGYGFISRKGEKVVPCRYSYLFDIDTYRVQDGNYESQYPAFYDGLAKVHINGKYGFVDTTGREVVPMKYSRVHRFSEGRGAFLADGKWGFVDKSGKEVIPAQYDDVYLFSGGLAWVKKDGKCGYIDRQGNVVILLRFVHEDREIKRSFHEGRVIVREEDKFGYYDRKGNALTPIQYKELTDFSNGAARANFQGKWGLLDTTGNALIPFTYSYISQSSDPEIFIVHTGREQGLMSRQGRPITPVLFDFSGAVWERGLTRVSFKTKRGYYQAAYVDKKGTVYSNDF